MRTYTIVDGVWNDTKLQYMCQTTPLITGQNIGQALNMWINDSRPYKWNKVTPAFIQKNRPSFWFAVQEQNGKTVFVVPKVIYYGYTGTSIIAKNGCRR